MGNSGSMLSFYLYTVNRSSDSEPDSRQIDSAILMTSSISVVAQSFDEVVY